jgi:hypothetical protein
MFFGGVSIVQTVSLSTRADNAFFADEAAQILCFQ